MTPDRALLFMTASHREALAGLTYAILHRKGFIALLGDAGTGKTTLIARVLGYLPADRVRSSVLLNPTVTSSEFLEMVMMDFGIPDIPASKAARLNLFQHFLVKAHTEQRLCILVVDEAHKLSDEVLEEIRLLGNLEFPDCKLLQIVLAGQSELGHILSRPEMRQLKQRFAVRLRLDPLSSSDVEQYIAFRWAKAGGRIPTPFAAGAIDEIVRFSKGIPRMVNSLCDNALLRAFGRGALYVTADDIVAVAKDLDLMDTAVMPVPVESERPHPEPSRPPEPLPALAAAPVEVMVPPVIPRIGMQTLDRYTLREPKVSFWNRVGIAIGTREWKRRISE